MHCPCQVPPHIPSPKWQQDLAAGVAPGCHTGLALVGWQITCAGARLCSSALMAAASGARGSPKVFPTSRLSLGTPWV